MFSDPEDLNFDVTIVSIPQCCGMAHHSESSDEEGSVCSCGNTTSSFFSDLEHNIAKGNTIENLVAVPEQLNKSMLFKFFNKILLSEIQVYVSSYICF